MELKVGLFGPEEMIERAGKVVQSDNNIEPLSFVFQTSEEIDRLIDQAFMSDVYVFLDPLAYHYSKQKIEKKKLPAVKIFKDEYALATAFYRLTHKHNHSLDRFSIDVANKKYVENILHDFDIPQHSVYVSDYLNKGKSTAEQIINFHRDLWNDGKIDFVMTSSKLIDQQLLKDNIPVYYIDIPQKHFYDTINQAKHLVHANDHSIKRVVSSYIALKSLTSNEQIPEDVISSVHQFLQDYQTKINAALTFDGDRQFTFIGTHELLTYLTNHLRSLPLIAKIEDKLPNHVAVHIGFGYGLTAKEAAENANLALKNSQQTNKSSCFIVNEREEVIGPIGIKRSFNKPKLYNELIHSARLNNQISYNFIQFISARNNEPFSSEDIAQFYKVTKRSAERTIKKLVSGNIITHVGEERPYVKGRPRKLFQLNQEISK